MKEISLRETSIFRIPIRHFLLILYLFFLFSSTSSMADAPTDLTGIGNDNIYDQGAIGSDFILDMDLIDKVEIIRGPGSSLGLY
jgi:hypothetical protein